MRIIDATWTPQAIVLAIDCDCGARLLHPTFASLCACPSCGRVEMWHAVAPEARTGMFSVPVMKREGAS